jgi:D-glycero-alpha-D-manno-heptose-7-phosphate kinase
MIIVQTPLRVGLFGGGTDFRQYYRYENGAVLNTTIDKYIFVMIKRRFDDKIRVGYALTEMVDGVSEIKHELIREALIKTGIDRGVEISTMADIPSAGSGLGSSSTVTVGALHAMYTYLGLIIPAERLAAEACEIEIDILKKPIGIQDQYIAAYGGLCFMEFTTSGEVLNEKINLEPEHLRMINENLILFYTGMTRKSSTILAEQETNIAQHTASLRKIKNLAYDARKELKSGNVDVIGEMLHEGWELKKELASRISNPYIDSIYETARKAGATGGKITGAGGGGFLLLYCPYEKQRALRKALGDLRELPFLIERDGSKVIFNYTR